MSKLKLLSIGLGSIVGLVVLGTLIYNRAPENVLLVGTDKNVKNELLKVEQLTNLTESKVASSSLERHKGRDALSGAYFRQASATGYYDIKGLSVENFLSIRKDLLSKYSAKEGIRTFCKDSPNSKTASCGYEYSQTEGYEVIKKDWADPQAPHEICYQGPTIEERQLNACVFAKPNGYFEHSTEKLNTSKYYNLYISMDENW